MLPREATTLEKACRTCGVAKQLSEFPRDNSGKHHKDGYDNRCKACSRARNAAYRASHHTEVIEKGRIYRTNNPEKVLEASRRHEATHKEERRAQDRNERAKNPEAARAKFLKWKEAHPDAYLASIKKHRETHREELNARQRQIAHTEEYRQKHAEYEAMRRTIDPEAHREKTRAWVKSKPGYEAGLTQARRARKNAAFVEEVDRLTVFERDNWTCGLCGEAVDKSYVWPDPRTASLDHVIPLAKGGKHSYDNVQLAHLRCNLAKRDGRTRRFKSLWGD